MVPDIVELLVTLGLIQQQTDADGVSSSGCATLKVSSSVKIGLPHIPRQQEPIPAKNQLRINPRFAVHFAKPKQFLVTPANILSEIAKAQAEIHLSRQRQELLKEALNMSDQHAAERIKHIVLQHPQVVDDPVYVTALRNLQVDGMLIAGASGNTTARNSNASQSSTIRDGSGKPKSGVGGIAKKIGGGKRRQSGITPLRRKRQKLKKGLNIGSGDVDGGPGKRANAPSSGSDVGLKRTTGGSLSTDRSKQVFSARATSISNASLTRHSISAKASNSKNT